MKNSISSEVIIDSKYISDLGLIFENGKSRVVISGTFKERLDKLSNDKLLLVFVDVMKDYFTEIDDLEMLSRTIRYLSSKI